jgi:hypothetical protein
MGAGGVVLLLASVISGEGYVVKDSATYKEELLQLFILMKLTEAKIHLFLYAIVCFPMRSTKKHCPNLLTT